MRTDKPSFDLLHEPWIPCVTGENTIEELGLLAAFERAHQLRGIRDPSPLVTCATHRFLAAILQACFPVADEDEWAGLWRKGRFDAEHLAKLEQICATRMDLFHEHHPFYQSGDIPLHGKSSERLKTVGYLYYEASTGTNITHFSHGGDATHALCPVCCAKGLLLQPAFASSGGAGIRPSINGVPPIYVMPLGESLFASLLLNHIIPDFQPTAAEAPDNRPLWDAHQAIREKTVRSGATYLESLSWPARRIRLFPGEGGACSACGCESKVLVRKIVYAQGWSLTEHESPWDDPWVAFRDRTEQNNVIRKAVMPREERSLWRDFPVLFLLSEDRMSLRPTVLNQISQFNHDGVIPEGLPMRYEAFSLRTDMKAKIFEWGHDVFDFPTPLLAGGPVVEIEVALRSAEDASGWIRSALKKLHPVTERSNPDRNALSAAMKSVSTQALRNYWNALGPCFRQMVADERLTKDAVAKGEWQKEWRECIKRCAKDAFEAAAEGFDSNAEKLRRQQKARSLFYGLMKKWEGGVQA